MSKYLIHTMPKRMWYVCGYLIPSMVSQGIDRDDIKIFNDVHHLGCLHACMRVFSELPDEGQTWHLQDDVIISKDFKQVTETSFETIACGFASDLYDKEAPSGIVNTENMWFSFQCILIPNKWAKECAEWCKRYIIGNPVYREYWEKGLNDDWVFKQYVKTFHKDCSIMNIAPNIVDHIDYIIGGSVASDYQRKSVFRSKYWKDKELVAELERRLNAIYCPERKEHSSDI